jgi:hypothetical protein
MVGTALFGDTPTRNVISGFGVKIQASAEAWSDPHDAIQRLALQSLSTEDLTVLADVIEPGRRECEWTESESTAVRALTGAFEQEVRRAGYRSMAEFQRHGFGPASMS